MPLDPGAAIGSYRVVAKLGEGGMGFFHIAADGQRFLFAPERLTSDASRFHVAIDWMPPDR